MKNGSDWVYEEAMSHTDTAAAHVLSFHAACINVIQLSIISKKTSQETCCIQAAWHDDSHALFQS